MTPKLLKTFYFEKTLKIHQMLHLQSTRIPKFLRILNSFKDILRGIHYLIEYRLISAQAILKKI